MAQINCGLKCFFLTYTVVFGIVGGTFIVLGMLYQVLTSEDTLVWVEPIWLIIMYVMGSITVLLALMGAHAVYWKNQESLMMFLFVIFYGTITVSGMGPKVIYVPQHIEERLEKEFHRFLPLNTSHPKIQQKVFKLQTQLHCCGLFSYSDWNNQFPDSCRCLQREEDQCIRVDNLTNPFFSNGSEWVYSKPCFPSFKYNLLISVKIIIGLYFILAFLDIVGLVLSITICCELPPESNSPTAQRSDHATEPISTIFLGTTTGETFTEPSFCLDVALDFC